MLLLLQPIQNVKFMKFLSFRIKNCFGFRDSGEVCLENQSNLIYILGRNSSGKSSFLNAINYFEVDIKPSEMPNFVNYNKSAGNNPELIGKFQISDSELKFDTFQLKFNSLLKEKGVEQSDIDSSPEFSALYKTLENIYRDLIDEICNEKEVSIHKLGDGSYHFIQNDFSKYEARKKQIAEAILSAQDSSKDFIFSSDRKNLGITFAFLEEILFYQFPKIYIFNKEYPLNESLPETITKEWNSKGNNFEKRFIDFLGKDDVNSYLTKEDPEEREVILERLRNQLEKLINVVNSHRSPVMGEVDLLDMRLDPFLLGLQLTVKTDSKKSYYSHLSDNTKFLFAYHLVSQTDEINNEILLFDEPSNGFHPTAQIKLLRFLQDLGKQGNLVIVSTHSEYLIDPNYLTSVRIMSSDETKYATVKNHFYNQTKEKGDFLALQPVFDAIGYKYGNQLEIEKNVIVVEGVTDLLYLRSFNKVLDFNIPLNIAPARGEGTIPHVVSFLISQGLSFKIVIDTGNITEHLKTDFDIDNSYIHEVPIPTLFVGRMNGSGIEDLFSKRDFETLLNLIGHNVTATFTNVSNSCYMKSNDVNKSDKRLVAHNFYEKVDTFDVKTFETETIDNFTKVLEFCQNEDWFSL